MQKYLLAFLLSLFGLVTIPVHSHAQEQEIAQLLLNVEKLNQLRQILQQLYDGYKILHEGYNKVKDITSGNYKIHELFLDGLYLVSPSVKKYHRVADIIKYQAAIVREYKAAFRNFSTLDIFTNGQLNYFSQVYRQLFEASVKNIDELLMIITAGELRMSDDERLAGIDRIFSDVEKKLLFLRSFNNRQSMIALEKLRDKVENETLRGLHSIP